MLKRELERQVAKLKSKNEELTEACERLADEGKTARDEIRKLRVADRENHRRIEQMSEKITFLDGCVEGWKGAGQTILNAVFKGEN